jgi:hypothetical protein
MKNNQFEQIHNDINKVFKWAMKQLN